MGVKIGRLRYLSFLTLLIGFALGLAAHLLYIFLADAQRFPINTVRIAASYEHISRKQLESILAKYLNSGFFALPTSQLHVDLLSIEWAGKVQINRVWPDILKIKLIEKIPVAIWNDGLLTQSGELFNVGNSAGVRVALPHLRGPDKQQKEVLQVYEKLSKILSIYGLRAASLEWRDNQAWDLTLVNGVRLYLGKRDLESRVIRFCKAYPAVFAEKSERLVSVDLRYPRGMAVQWRKKREENG